MNGIEWWPADYLDEVMPPGRASPDDWIIRHGDGYAIAPADEGNSESLPVRLSDGAVVEFSCEETFGSATLYMDRHGFWKVDAPMPEEATQCCVMGGWQSETVADTVHEMIHAFIDASPDAAETYEVSQFAWKPGGRWRFQAATKSFVDAGVLQ